MMIFFRWLFKKKIQMNSLYVGVKLKSQSLIRRAVYLCACKLKIVCSIVWQLLNALAIILKRAFNCFMVTLIVFERTFVFNGQRRRRQQHWDSFFLLYSRCFSIFPHISLFSEKELVRGEKHKRGRKKSKIKFWVYVVLKVPFMGGKVWDIMQAINSFGSNK